WCWLSAWGRPDVLREPYGVHGGRTGGLCGTGPGGRRQTERRRIAGAVVCPAAGHPGCCVGGDPRGSRTGPHSATRHTTLARNGGAPAANAPAGRGSNVPDR